MVVSGRTWASVLEPLSSGLTFRRGWQFRQPWAFQKLVQGQQAGAEGGPSSPRGAVGGLTAGDVGLAAGGVGLGDWGRGRRDAASARAFRLGLTVVQSSFEATVMAGVGVVAGAAAGAAMGATIGAGSVGGAAGATEMAAVGVVGGAAVGQRWEQQLERGPTEVLLGLPR